MGFLNCIEVKFRLAYWQSPAARTGVAARYDVFLSSHVFAQCDQKKQRISVVCGALIIEHHEGPLKLSGLTDEITTNG